MPWHAWTSFFELQLSSNFWCRKLPLPRNRGGWGNKVCPLTSLVPRKQFTWSKPELQQSLKQNITLCDQKWGRCVNSLSTGPCDLRVLNEMAPTLHLPCALKITYREILLGSYICWVSQWLLWGKQGHWRFLSHDGHGFHLTPEVRQYHRHQADSRKRNPRRLFKKPKHVPFLSSYFSKHLKAEAAVLGGGWATEKYLLFWTTETLALA